MAGFAALDERIAASDIAHIARSRGEAEGAVYVLLGGQLSPWLARRVMAAGQQKDEWLPGYVLAGKPVRSVYAFFIETLGASAAE